MAIPMKNSRSRSHLRGGTTRAIPVVNAIPDAGTIAMAGVTLGAITETTASDGIPDAFTTAMAGVALGAITETTVSGGIRHA